VQWAAFVQIAPAIPCFTYASDRAMGCFCADSAQRIRVVKTIVHKRSGETGAYRPSASFGWPLASFGWPYHWFPAGIT